MGRIYTYKNDENESRFTAANKAKEVALFFKKLHRFALCAYTVQLPDRTDLPR
jgi:hypothetical protein